MNTKINKAVKQCGNVICAVLAGLFVPVLLFVALGFGLRQLFIEWRSLRNRLLSGDITCSINNDCPPGYECVSGRCVPYVPK